MLSLNRFRDKRLRLSDVADVRIQSWVNQPFQPSLDPNFRIETVDIQTVEYSQFFNDKEDTFSISFWKTRDIIKCDVGLNIIPTQLTVSLERVYRTDKKIYMLVYGNNDLHCYTYATVAEVPSANYYKVVVPVRVFFPTILQSNQLMFQLLFFTFYTDKIDACKFLMRSVLLSNHIKDSDSEFDSVNDEEYLEERNDLFEPYFELRGNSIYCIKDIDEYNKEQIFHFETNFHIRCVVRKHGLSVIVFPCDTTKIIQKQKKYYVRYNVFEPNVSEIVLTINSSSPHLKIKANTKLASFALVRCVKDDLNVRPIEMTSTRHKFNLEPYKLPYHNKNKELFYTSNPYVTVDNKIIHPISTPDVFTNQYIDRKINETVREFVRRCDPPFDYHSHGNLIQYFLIGERKLRKLFPEADIVNMSSGLLRYSFVIGNEVQDYASDEYSDDEIKQRYTIRNKKFISQKNDLFSFKKSLGKSPITTESSSDSSSDSSSKSSSERKPYKKRRTTSHTTSHTSSKGSSSDKNTIDICDESSQKKSLSCEEKKSSSNTQNSLEEEKIFPQESQHTS